MKKFFTVLEHHTENDTAIDTPAHRTMSENIKGLRTYFFTRHGKDVQNQTIRIDSEVTASVIWS